MFNIDIVVSRISAALRVLVGVCMYAISVIIVANENVLVDATRNNWILINRRWASNYIRQED